jgi:hypothetical protein
MVGDRLGPATLTPASECLAVEAKMLLNSSMDLTSLICHSKSPGKGILFVDLTSLICHSKSPGKGILFVYSYGRRHGSCQRIFEGVDPQKSCQVYWRVSA